MTSQTVRRGAPLAAGAAVLALLAGSAYLLRGDAAGPAASPPPVLRIGAGSAAFEHAGTKGRVTVQGTLPDGPASARVHRFGSAEVDVRRLADALGVRPATIRVGAGAGSPWQFARDGSDECLDQPLGASPDDPVTSSCVAPAPPPAAEDPPGDAAVRAAARPVLSAAGLDLDDATVDPATPGVATRAVRVDPVVGDAPTTGLATAVLVDDRGVVSAWGWLGATSPGDSYPVIGAQEAVDRLAAMPVPLMACPESATPVPPGPVCGGPMEVTGAAFGLSLQWEGEQPVLVPTWLFDVTGGTEPIGVVAVDPSYLADPPSTQAPGDDGSGSAPAAPGGQPTAATSRFESVAPVDGGNGLSVTFYGGVDSCYSYTVVAEESAEQVSLRLTEKTTGEVCIELAQHYERTVPLDAPLGDRRVVDAETGDTLH